MRNLVCTGQLANGSDVVSFLRHFASSQSSWIGARASFEGDAYSPFPILGYRNEAFEMTVCMNKESQEVPFL